MLLRARYSAAHAQMCCNGATSTAPLSCIVRVGVYLIANMEHMEKALTALQNGWESEERKWLVSLRSPLDIWQENPTFLACEILVYAWALLTLRHAFKHRGRCLLLWQAAILHGLVTEALSYVLPDIDNFWHGRTMIMLFKQRLPLHIMFFYPCFHYTTNMAVGNLKLPWWAEPFAVALGDLVLDIPFDILGIKLIWWTWHDTDPNIFDRTYSVPWTSYAFHLAFASSFTFLINSTRWLLTGSRDKEKMAGNYFIEFACVIITACLTMPMAALFQFTPLYHAFHDLYDVHTEVCVCVMIGLYVILGWSGDRGTGMEARSATQNSGGRLRRHSPLNELSLAIILHYLFYIVLVFIASPESYRSTGPHETVGDCDSVSTVMTVTGLALHKKTYLCLSNYTEPYFDFHCLSKDQLPMNGSNYYTVCGTPFPNHMEYKLIIVASCLFGLAFYYQWFFRSAKPNKVKKA